MKNPKYSEEIERSGILICLGALMEKLPGDFWSWNQNKVILFKESLRNASGLMDRSRPSVTELRRAYDGLKSFYE